MTSPHEPLDSQRSLNCQPRCPQGGKRKANASSRVAGVLETRKTPAGDTCIRCFQTITKPA